MKEIFVKINCQCNNACLGCLNLKKYEKYYVKFKPNYYTKKIEDFVLEGGEKLILSGGEPLISKDLFNWLTFAKEKGIKSLLILTNGRMLSYERMVLKLKEFEPISFLVSFHFPNDNLYRKYTRSQGFHQVVKGIKNLVKHNCDFTVTTVTMRPNLIYLEKIIKMLKDMGVKNYQYRFIDGLKVIHAYKKFVLRYQECVPVIKKIIKENPDVDIKLRMFPVCVVGEELRNRVLPILSPELSILTCQKIRGAEILINKKIKRQQSLYPDCRKCLYFYVCEGMTKKYVQIYGIKEFEPIV